jgi:glycosyltransferase involved in cell wall biosynthesis
MKIGGIHLTDVGIVMPVYTQKPFYLRMALRSILKQSYTDFHFVIVIDGASPQTIQIVKKETQRDQRVQMIEKKENLGVAKALNTGFDRLMKWPEIKYLTWVSSDNVYYPEFINKLREALLQGGSELGLVYSSFRHVDERGIPRQDLKLVEFRKYQENPKENLLDFCFIGTSFMYKKKFAQLIDGYLMEPVEDYEYWLRLTEHCEIQYVSAELMDYRENSPYSVSAQLRTSKEQHRRWRYAYNLSKYEARVRRGIPFETTVLFPTENGSEETIDTLERLLEQSYSNYELKILDISKNGEAKKGLQSILDPKITYISLPGATKHYAVKKAMENVSTPFSLIYEQGIFPSTVSAFYHMVLLSRPLLKKAVKRKMLTIFDIGKGRMKYQHVTTGIKPRFNELLLTNHLKKILNIHGS